MASLFALVVPKSRSIGVKAHQKGRLRNPHSDQDEAIAHGLDSTLRDALAAYPRPGSASGMLRYA